MKRSKLILSAALAVAGSSLALTPAQAIHVYGGIIDTNGTPGLQAGDALSFVNNTTGVPITSLPTRFLFPSGNALRPGTFDAEAPPSDENISFTALSRGLAWNQVAYRPASAFAAASGSVLFMQMIGATGPAGATVSMWDIGINPSGAYNIWTIGTGLTTGTGITPITETSILVGDGVNDGVGEPPTTVNNPAVDPFGHIHNDRNVSVSEPGAYTVTWILKDSSGQQTDSAPFTASYFAAVPEPTSLALLGGTGVLIGALRRRRSA